MREMVVKELGIENLSKEHQDEVLSRLAENILQRASVSALERLSPENREKFSNIANESGPAAAHAFLAGEIPNFNSILQEETRTEIAEIKKSLT